MWDKYIHNNASNCMKKPQNDSLYKVGTKYDTDSTNFKEANKLPEVKNTLHRTSFQTVIQCRCMPLLCQLSGKDDLSVSACMDTDFLLMTGEAKHQQPFAEWNASSHFPFPHFPFPHFLISSFPHFLISHFLFLISHFLFLISSFLLLEGPLLLGFLSHFILSPLLPIQAVSVCLWLTCRITFIS